MQLTDKLINKVVGMFVENRFLIEAMMLILLVLALFFVR